MLKLKEDQAVLAIRELNKMKRSLNFLIVIIFILLFSSNNFSQQINELKEKKKQIEKEIVNINLLIDKTEKESSNSLTNIKLTKKKIELKNSLIKQIDNEVEEVNCEINTRKERIDSLSSRVSLIKSEYRRIILYSQKNNFSNNLLLQIFSAKDFNQAYKRLKFYQQVLEYKKQIALKFKENIKQITEETIRLNENVNLLSKKQKEKEQEVNSLKKDEQNIKSKIEQLAQKKKKLLAELEDQKKTANKLTDEIRKLIEEEAKKEADRIKNSKPAKANYALLSSNFKDNIGKFVLPVQNGIITGVYGESFHPVLKEVKVKNNGIDITVSNNTQVYTIFKGEVRKIIKIPGANLAVLIRHGNYLTVYSNLSVVSVSVGQDLNTFQKIGEINLQKGEETAILHFELWNENKTEDPEKWFKK